MVWTEWIDLMVRPQINPNISGVGEVIFREQYKVSNNRAVCHKIFVWVPTRLLDVWYSK